MPKQEVTAALAYFLDPQQSNISSLGRVYTALPRVASESDLFQYVPPGSSAGSIIYLFLSDQIEERVALGGQHGGNKFRTYTLTLLCIMKTELDDSEAEQALFDQFIDDLTAWIQSDRNAFTEAVALGGRGPYAGTGVIFQLGEGGINEGPDLHFEYPVPHTINGGVMIHQAVGRVTVCEVFTST